MMTDRVLLVEDDVALGTHLKRTLLNFGYQVDWAQNGAQALLLSANRPDLILLDWMLPDATGLELVHELRSSLHGRATPVFFLTARDSVTDKVSAFRNGACDYLTKPFEIEELVVRVEALLRRFSSRDQPNERNEQILQGKELVIDCAAHSAVYKGKRLDLTHKEFELLRLLVVNAGRVFSRDELLDRVWGYDSYPYSRTVDVHVLRLRQKICSELIQTVRGAGYRIDKDTFERV